MEGLHFKESETLTHVFPAINSELDIDKLEDYKLCWIVGLLRSENLDGFFSFLFLLHFSALGFLSFLLNFGL